MDEKAKNILRGQLMLATITYVISSYRWIGLSDAEIGQKVHEWEDESTNMLLSTLEKAGYTIVPKEVPAAFKH